MADCALRPEASEKDVFELDKDERWQARLAEARVRRAIALREKANSETAPKVRRKPWEEGGESGEDIVEPIEPLLQPENEDRLDFSDRVENLRHVTSRPGDNGAPGSEDDAPDETGVAALAPVAKSASVADKYFERLSSDFEPAKPYVPPSKDYDWRSDEAPVVRSTPPSPQAFAAREPEQPDFVADEDPRDAGTSSRTRRRGVPVVLLSAICFLAVLPFATSNPVLPLEMGPISAVSSPSFRLQPALGLPRPMNAVPARTSPGEWRGPEAPKSPLMLQTGRVGPQQREVASLPVVALGEAGLDAPGWPAPMPGVLRHSAPVLAEPTAGRPPGVPAVVPETRAAEAASVPQPLSILRVTVLVPSAGDLDMADDLAADLAERGHDVARVKPVELKISERNVRFFHEGDRGEAARLAEAYEARLRDFTSFRPQPADGTVEIWLEGEGAARPAVSRPVRPATAPEPEPVAPQTPRVIIVQRTPSLMERIAGVLGARHEGSGEPRARTGGGSVAPVVRSTSGSDVVTGGETITSGGVDTVTEGGGLIDAGSGTQSSREDTESVGGDATDGNDAPDDTSSPSVGTGSPGLSSGGPSGNGNGSDESDDDDESGPGSDD